MRIITDSASDITLEQLEKYNIDMIPLTITVGEQILLDDKKKDMIEFWNLMEKEHLKTSQPTPASFLDLFEEIKKNGEEAICVCVSSALSGTYSTAVMAKEMVEYDKIHIVDSRTATIGQGFIVRYACQLRDQGVSFEEAIVKIEEFKYRVKILACIDTLEYLARGGRMPASISSFGDFLKLKPVITVNNKGVIELIKMKRGKKKAIQEILDLYKNSSIDTNFPIVPIFSKDDANMQDLIAGLDGLDASEQVGCAIGCHTGPNIYGLVFVTK
ncbi:MAG: DegV family protein [Firmicutes bacterium]|nr:DegV family protein [Bacillota bacterium]